MKKNSITILLVCVVALGLALSGCGSGGSSGTLASNPSSSTVSGVATLGTTAIGTVSIKDSSVPALEKTTTISSNGSYALNVTGLKAPYLLKATTTDETGTSQMYSMSSAGGKANINQISDAAVTAAANGSDGTTLYAMRSGEDEYRRTSVSFESIINQLRTVLAPLFALYNISGNGVTNDDDESDSENGGLRAMLRDVRIVVSSRTVTVTNRQTGGVIFSGPANNLASGTFSPENMPAGPGGSGSTSCSYTYSAWGACQNNTQSRTLISSSPAGCTGTPILTQACVSAPPACTYNYSNWGACQSNNTQTRTVTSSPAGCIGTPAALTQSCTYVPPVTACTSFTYSVWGACQSNNTQTRTVATQSPTGCTGGTPVLSQACIYTPPTIDGAALYASNCSGCHGALATSSKRGRTLSQIQTAITNNTGGMGSLSSLTSAQIQAIATALASTPPATCTSFTYSVWSACDPTTLTQTRTVATQSPTGCTGGTPVLSQACTPPPTTCTSFTYNVWGACQSNNTQTRTVATQSPTGCTGGSPVLSQACTYIDGAALYTQYCSGCHGNGKKGKSTTAIQNAINNNTGGMGSLSSLTAAQIAAISAAP